MSGHTAPRRYYRGDNPRKYSDLTRTTSPRPEWMSDKSKLPKRPPVAVRRRT